MPRGRPKKLTTEDKAMLAGAMQEVQAAEETKPETLELPATIEVNPLDTRSPAEFVLAEIRRILTMTGQEVYATFAAQNPNKPQRLADLGRFGYRPLRWSELKPRMRREMDKIIAFHSDDYVRYGDTVVMVAKPESYLARQRYKNALREQRLKTMTSEGSVDQLRREFPIPGVQVTDKDFTR